ncbi:MAG TPA: DUF2442 domain-containing protein [Tepidiformaceae bacterium]
MSTSAAKLPIDVEAVEVAVDAERLRIVLNDGRQVSVPLKTVSWLSWLAEATPEQRSNWVIEPGGYAVFWPDLDDGVEIGQLLERHTLS